MNHLSDISYIKQLLSRHGFTFSKSLGQNFLVNPSVCPRMAEECGVTEQSGVIEIGPGIGVLTAELSKRSKKVVCIELDSRLPEVLSETLDGCGNVEIINDDILKIDLEKLIDEKFGDMSVVVCANLPYYITSPVIMKLLESRLRLESITVMIQKEAAQRICAEVGSRNAGAITVGVNFYAEAQKLFDVSRGSFMPSPNVDSCVIRLDIRKDPPARIDDEKEFFRMVKAIFAQRRKTSLNAISAGMGIDKATVLKAIQSAGFNSTVRGESLTIEELARLSNALIAQTHGEKVID